MKKAKTFEEAMLRLDEIVAALDKADLPLEQSLSLFSEGAELVALCNTKLADAQLKIETLYPEKTAKRSSQEVEQ